MELPEHFYGAATPRSADIYDRLADQLKCEVAVITAVVMTEAAGEGFEGGRPKILFERHKFSAFTNGQFDVVAPDISNTRAGGYIGGPLEYTRLMRAMDYDRLAALRATSWGLPQIMGFNFALTGYVDVESFVAAMCEGEDEQLDAFAAFVKAAGLQDELQDKRFRDFTRGYNGTGNVDEYTRRLVANFTKTLGTRNDVARPLAQWQALLNLTGYGPLLVDGFVGPKTETATKRFQRDHGLTVDGVIGPDTQSALLGAVPKPPVLPAQRSN